MKSYYKFSLKTFELLGIVEYQDLEKMPEDCTEIAPPSYSQFEIPVFSIPKQKWSIAIDYRRKLDRYGNPQGGRPYYDPAKFWWAEETYNVNLGGIPKGMVWQKIDKPEICTEVTTLQSQYDALVEELKATDYYARRCYEYEKGFDTQTSKERYEFYVSELRRLALERPKLDEWEAEISSKKAEIVDDYTEEALEHL